MELTTTNLVIGIAAFFSMQIVSNLVKTYMDNRGKSDYDTKIELVLTTLNNLENMMIKFSEQHKYLEEKVERIDRWKENTTEKIHELDKHISINKNKQ